MLERAGARLWVSIVAAVIAFPVATVVLLAAWIIRAQAPLSTSQSAATLAATAPISTAQEKAETAVPPPRGAVTEPIALPPQARTPEPSSTMPMLGNPSAADIGRVQDARAEDAQAQEAQAQEAQAQEAQAQEALPSGPPIMTAEPAAREPSEPSAAAAPPMPAQVEAAAPLPPATVVDRIAPATDAKAPDVTSALSLFATLAVAPPTPSHAFAYADQTQDTLPPASPTIAGKPAALELSESTSALVPLPKRKPHVTVARIGPAVPLPRPRPAASSPPPQARP